MPSKTGSLEPAARVRRKDGVVLRHVAGEHMLVPTVTREVDLDSLFLLNATGAFVWEQLDGIRSVSELGAAVAEHDAHTPALLVIGPVLAVHDELMAAVALSAADNTPCSDQCG